MRIVDIIEKKRDGLELSTEEIDFFINGYCDGSITDYQAAALIMAAFIRGLNSRETADLTNSMTNSGDRMIFLKYRGSKWTNTYRRRRRQNDADSGADSCRLRDTGGKNVRERPWYTGGTIDKLEAIKGFRTSLSRSEFINGVKEIGIAISGQTGNLAPADKKLYALRDVTATVNSIPLIASSIMSKKLASGADKIILDVKTGSGAFMKTLDESIELAAEMVSIGDRMGKKTVAVITDMDTPLADA
jgi:pyrimidine-nucleoside phosphorylase